MARLPVGNVRQGHDHIPQRRQRPVHTIPDVRAHTLPNDLSDLFFPFPNDLSDFPNQPAQPPCSQPTP
eukprot:2884870-Rhodomonas_salina.1